jgi:flavodoxin
MNSLIVIHSYHHNNTEKVANTIAEVIGAGVRRVEELTKRDLDQYGLVGFGSGIDSGKHYKELLYYTEGLSPVTNKPCFIFSTSAIQGEKKVSADHLTLRELLIKKGYKILGEFSCKGFNTNSFLKYFGGMNKKRPNTKDLDNAKYFATNLLTKFKRIK